MDVLNQSRNVGFDELVKVVKELRLFSIGAFIFTAYLLQQVIEWVTTRSEPSAIGDGIAITGIIGALVGLCKFIFEFAIRKSSTDSDDTV